MLLLGLAPDPALAQAYGEVPILLEARTDAFDDASTLKAVPHVPLKAAAARWKLCAVFPHIKDEYWLSVAYGMAEETRRLGVALTISETGGYRSADAQAHRLRDCTGDAAILGSVSYDGPEMMAAIAAVSRRMPVIAAVNDVASRDIAVKVGVSWRDMGRTLGRHLAWKHPKGSVALTAVLATGPKEAGWVSILGAGLDASLAHSSITLMETGWADTGPQEQLELAESLLEHHASPDLFIGSAPAAEAVVSLKRMRGIAPAMKVVATYYTQAVRRGIMRGRIETAPFDDPALQGRLAIEYAVRAIEGKVDHRQIGPPVTLVTRETLPPYEALAPADFRPIFEIP